MRAVLLALFLCFAAGAYENITPDYCTRSIETAERLSGKFLEIRFSLITGRLVWFSGKDGKNLLWVNDDKEIYDYHKRLPRSYLNFGGDKIWLIPQSLWQTAFGKQWPPPIPLEGMPWKVVQKSACSITVKSQVIPQLGVELERTFTLAEHAPLLTVKNTVRRLTANPYPVQLWSITQVRHPAFCVEEIPAKSAFPKPYIIYKRPEYSRLIANGRLLRQDICVKEFGAKSGTLGSFAAAVYADGKMLLQSHSVRPGGCYPEGASIQVHTNAYYVELETLDELVHLLPGESRTNQVTWSLLPEEYGLNR